VLKDSLFFFRSFFSDVSSRFGAETEGSKASTDVGGVGRQYTGDPVSLMTSPKHSSSSSSATAPVMTVGGSIVSDVCDSSSSAPRLPADADEMLLILSGMNDAAADVDSSRESQDSSQLNAAMQAPIFFK